LNELAPAEPNVNSQGLHPRVQALEVRHVVGLDGFGFSEIIYANLDGSNKKSPGQG